MRTYFLVTIMMLSYLISTTLLAFGPGGEKRAIKSSSFFCRWALKILNIRLHIHGKPAQGIIVANHLSYVDILSILAVSPRRFITFTEMGDTPLIGFIAKISQTLFVHRSKPSLVRKDIERFEKELRKGSPFAFFPEGASFEGSKLYPFKSSLFESAIRTGTPIQPVCLRYMKLDDEPVSLKNRDRIFYHGDMNLISQLFGLLSIKSMDLEMVFCDPISAEGRTRKDLSQMAYDEISKHFRAVVA